MRAVIVAAAVAFIISLFGTPVAIRVFTALKAGQPIRSLGLTSNAAVMLWSRLRDAARLTG